MGELKEISQVNWGPDRGVGEWAHEDSCWVHWECDERDVLIWGGVAFRVREKPGSSETPRNSQG